MQTHGPYSVVRFCECQRYGEGGEGWNLQTHCVPPESWVKIIFKSVIANKMSNWYLKLMKNVTEKEKEQEYEPTSI